MSALSMWHKVRLIPLHRPVVFNAVLLAVSILLFGVRYQTNDDGVIAALLGGTASAENAYVLFVNPLLTQVLVYAGQFVPGVSLWPIFLLVACWGSQTLCYGVLNARGRRAMRYGAGELTLVATWVVFAPLFYSALQFTQAAFLLGCAGMLLCVAPVRRRAVWHRVAGVAVCVLGSMVRFEAALFFLPMFAVLVWRYRYAWRAFVCVLVACAALHGSNRHAHRQAGDGVDLTAWNGLRSDLSDKPAIGAAEEPDEVTADDIRMVEMFAVCDTAYFDAERLRRLKQARDGESLWRHRQASLWRAGDLFTGEQMWRLLPFWLVFLVSCAVCYKRDPLRMWAVAALLFAALLYMASIARLELRVTAPCFFTAIVCNLYRCCPVMRCKVWHGALLGCACVLGVLFVAARGRDVPQLPPQAGELLLRYIEQHPKSVFYVQAGHDTLDNMGGSIFTEPPSCTLPNAVTLGGWHFPLPKVQKQLARLGRRPHTVRHLLKANSYIVCLTPQGDQSGLDRAFLTLLQRHVRNRYGVDTQVRQERTLAGVRIYQLVAAGR